VAGQEISAAPVGECLQLRRDEHRCCDQKDRRSRGRMY
jgi:hypothetical protein